MSSCSGMSRKPLSKLCAVFSSHCPLCCQGQGRHAPLSYLPWLPREKVTQTVMQALGTALSGKGQQQHQKPRP